jgi:hypothetical protein
MKLLTLDKYGYVIKIRSTEKLFNCLRDVKKIAKEKSLIEKKEVNNNY